MTGSLKLPDWLSTASLQKQWGSLTRVSLGSDNRPTLFIYWDRRFVLYAVIAKRKEALQRLELGRIDRTADREPIDQVKDHLADRFKIGSVVVVLSRAELEATELTLPPADEAETTALVHAQIEERLSDGEAFPTIDYIESQQSADLSRQVTAYVAPANLMQRLADACEEASWRLAAVVPRGLMPLGLLQPATFSRWPTAVALTLLDGEAEWIVLRGGKPQRQRTVRSGSDERDLLGDQIWSEIQRSFAMEGEASAEPHLIAFGDPARLGALTGPLLSRFREDVTVLQPFHVIPGSDSPDPMIEQHWFAPIIGSAKLFFEQRLPVDLMHPKSPPKKANPLRRWMPIASLAAFAFVVLGYVLYGDITELQAEYDQKKEKLDRDEKLANKQAEKGDVAQVVDAWRADEVNWLEPLKQLSEKLPEGRSVTVRRLTGAASANGVVIDLSVQIDNESTVAQFERAIRSSEVGVTSRRVAERSAGTDYPWQFETQIVYSRNALPVPEPPELEQLEIVEESLDDSQDQDETEAASSATEDNADARSSADSSNTRSSQADTNTPDLSGESEASK